MFVFIAILTVRIRWEVIAGVKRISVTAHLLLAGLALLAPLLTHASAQAATRYEAGISTSASLLWMNDRNLDARLTDIQRLGATWIRVDFSWPSIQPKSPYVSYWEMYDRVVRAASIHHLKILAVLDYTPAWAQEPRCAVLVITKAAGKKCSPATTTMFATFARAAALRYKGTSIRAWELWNEPNISSYWKTTQADNHAVHADARSYAALANAAAYQIRHNYPDSLIITGGLGPMFQPVYPKGIRQSDFLAVVLPLLNPALFDGIGIHPYSWPALPTTAALWSAFYTVDHGPPAYNLRAVMARAGWGNKQLWGTEFGAPTKGVSTVVIPTPTSRPDHVSEAIQAQIVAQGLRAWYQKGNVGPLFIHSDSDQWLPQIKNEGGFGLRRSDGTKKPAYDAFQKIVQAL